MNANGKNRETREANEKEKKTEDARQQNACSHFTYISTDHPKQAGESLLFVILSILNNPVNSVYSLRN